MSVLAIEGLHVAYGRSEVVRGFDLALQPGESYGLVGESGCGKSTVAFAVMGHLAGTGRVTRGTIRVAGQAVTGLDEPALRPLRGRVMAMVYQDPVSALNPTMQIGRQLAEAAEVAAAGGANDIARVLARVRLPQPEALLRRYPHQLSGGQLQRVVIAMALLAHPRLLILDEPTTGLDVTVEAEVVGLIAEIAAEERIALLYISHNLGLMARVASRIGIMYAGRLVEDGPARAVLRAPAHPYTRALLACLPGRRGAPLAAIPGQVPGPGDLGPGCAFAPRCGFARPGLCDVPPGVAMVPAPGGQQARCRRLADLPSPDLPSPDRPAPDGPSPAAPDAAGPAPEAADLLLRVEGVSRRFGGTGWRRGAGVVAADRVGFDIRAGETVALVGESGSGKSSLARILIGLDTADAGRADYLGHNLAMLPAGARPQPLIRAVQMVFQNPDGTLNPAHRVGRILARALKRAGRPHGAADVARLLALVRLPPDHDARFPAALSGGQRQRVAIARAFAGEPALIIADEPVSALDVSVQAAIIGLLGGMTAEHGTAVLLISHDLMLVRQVADHVVVLYRGQVMEQGRTEAVFRPPHHVVRPLAAPDDPGPPPPGGCPFQPRCHRRIARCATVAPPVIDAGGGHRLTCHHDPETLQRAPPAPAPGAVASQGGADAP
jgi:peptide/nickel transport system ATP-binding protein